MSKWVDGSPGWVVCWKCGGTGSVWMADTNARLSVCSCPDCDGSPIRRKMNG